MPEYADVDSENEQNNQDIEDNENIEDNDSDDDSNNQDTFSLDQLNQLENPETIIKKLRVPKLLRKYMEMDNIAEDLDEQQRTKIVDICLSGLDADKESRRDWEEKMKKAFDLVKTTIKSKNTPWKDSANIKYPLITSACMHFNARVIPEIVKNDRVVEVRVMVPDDDMHTIDDRASRLSAHMSYQLLGQSDHWLWDTDRALMILPMMGVVFRKSFFNPIIGQPDTMLCLPDEIIINANVSSLESARRITHIQFVSSNDLIENMKAGLYIEYDLKDLCQSYMEPNNDGINIEGKLTTQPVQIYSNNDDYKNQSLYDLDHERAEIHGWLDLDGDNYQEPYIITIHRSSRKLLRISARYNEDSFDYNSNGEMIKINAINNFTDYHFIPDPCGSYYSLGFGMLLLETNETVNTALNQLIDAGTLSNMQSGFIGSGVRINSGDLTFKPGEWKHVPTVAGNVLSQNIVPLPIKEPSVVLFNLMQYLVDSTKTITSITDMMSGDNPPPNQPAATTMAMVEESQKIYSSVLGRIYQSLKKEFQKLFEINKRYLNKQERFIDAEKSGMVFRDDYLINDYGIFPVADPKLSSTVQRVSQAQALLALISDPIINKVEIYKNYLRILKVKNVDNYIVLPDPNAPPPPEQLKTEAEIQHIKMKTAGELMDRELKATELGLKEVEISGKNLHYGGKLAKDKIDSVIQLAQLHNEEPGEDIERAVADEEAMTTSTQQQGIPVGPYNTFKNMQAITNESIAKTHEQINPQPQSQMQQPQLPQNITPVLAEAAGLPQENA